MGRAYEVKNFIKEEVLFRDLEKRIFTGGTNQTNI